MNKKYRCRTNGYIDIEAEDIYEAKIIAESKSVNDWTWNEVEVDEDD